MSIHNEIVPWREHLRKCRQEEDEKPEWVRVAENILEDDGDTEYD